MENKEILAKLKETSGLSDNDINAYLEKFKDELIERGISEEEADDAAVDRLQTFLSREIIVENKGTDTLGFMLGRERLTDWAAWARQKLLKELRSYADEWATKEGLLTERGVVPNTMNKKEVEAKIWRHAIEYGRAIGRVDAKGNFLYSQDDQFRGGQIIPDHAFRSASYCVIRPEGEHDFKFAPIQLIDDAAAIVTPPSDESIEIQKAEMKKYNRPRLGPYAGEIIEPTEIPLFKFIDMKVGIKNNKEHEYIANMYKTPTNPDKEYVNFKDYLEYIEFAHPENVLSQLSDLEEATKDLERGRGWFLIKGNVAKLSPTKTGKTRIDIIDRSLKLENGEAEAITLYFEPEIDIELTEESVGVWFLIGVYKRNDGIGINGLGYWLNDGQRKQNIVLSEEEQPVSGEAPW